MWPSPRARMCRAELTTRSATITLATRILAEHQTDSIATRTAKHEAEAIVTNARLNDGARRGS